MNAADGAPSNPPGQRPVSGTVWTQVFSGIGLGLLLGLIAGMSVSPVVQTILGALITVVTGFLSVQGGEGDSGSFFDRIKVNELRIGSFGVAAVVGILLGMTVRSNDLLSGSIEYQVQRWTAAGYEKSDALKYVAFEKLGIMPKGVDVAVGDMQKAKSSSLFTELSKIDLCAELDPARYGRKSVEVLAAYRQQQNDQLKAFADQVEKQGSPEHQLAVLEANWKLLCEMEKLKTR